MKTNNIFVYVLVLLGSLAASPVMAWPVSDANITINQNPSPLGTTAIADPVGVGQTVTNIAYGDGSIKLSDYNGNGLYTMDPSWWNLPGVVYTTTTNTIFIDFLDLDVTAFTFGLGANQNATGWIRAYYDTPSTSNTLLTGNFGINSTTTNTYGVYVNNPSTNCSVIKRIEIEPTFVWGVGNFGITTRTSECGQTVPEPSAAGLLGLGLMVMGFMAYTGRRRRQELVL